jgi:hypothetical protein
MDAIKQEQKERVLKYYERFNKLFQQGQIQDAKQCCRFLARLRPKIKKLCGVWTYTNIEEMVIVIVEIERVLGKLGETPYEPIKEEHDEIMYEESTTNHQLHVLKTFINFFGKGTNGKAGLSSIVSVNTNTIVNYVGQQNIPLQHALNLQTQGQNVPSAEVGIRLRIVI